MSEPRVEAGDRALETARKIHWEETEALAFDRTGPSVKRIAALIQSAMNALVEPLKDECDRDWKDETPEQIVAIAANAIYWRTGELRDAMNAQERELTRALAECVRQMEDAASLLDFFPDDYGEAINSGKRLLAERGDFCETHRPRPNGDSLEEQ